MHSLVSAIRESAAAQDAIKDAEDETFGQRTNKMMLDIPKKDESWEVETASWVYIGIIHETCRDCLILKNCVRVHHDGRHGQLWADGDHTSAEIEAHGGKDGIAVISADAIIEMSPWPHPIPKPH